MAIILPQIVVEAALVAGNPVSGSGTMTLDNATFGLLDTAFLAGADAWTDISPYIRGFSITRAATREQGPLLQAQNGTCTVDLDNSDGRFDPDNLSGPYVISGVSQIRPMVPIRIRAVFSGSYPLFRGFADSWAEPPVTFAGSESIWTVSATDGFKILSSINLATIGSAGANELTGARINRILDASNWYSGQGAGSRVVAAGDSQLQATTFGDTPLNLMQTASDSEIGTLYMDGSGAVVFRNRKAFLTDSRSVNSQATFGDNPVAGGPELPCASITRANDDTTIANDVQATRVGGTLQEVKDTASIATYLFPRTYVRDDLLLTVDTDVASWAGWVLYISKGGEDRFESIDIDPQADPVNLWPQVLGRDIGDRITVVRRPPGVSPVTRDCFITGITHTFSLPAFEWLTTFHLQDATKYGSFMTLDNAATGRLNQNALVY